MHKSSLAAYSGIIKPFGLSTMRERHMQHRSDITPDVATCMYWPAILTKSGVVRYTNKLRDTQDEQHITFKTPLLKILIIIRPSELGCLHEEVRAKRICTLQSLTGS